LKFWVGLENIEVFVRERPGVVEQPRFVRVIEIGPQTNDDAHKNTQDSYNGQCKNLEDGVAVVKLSSQQRIQSVDDDHKEEVIRQIGEDVDRDSEVIIGLKARCLTFLEDCRYYRAYVAAVYG
jgi:hypothetical protein